MFKRHLTDGLDRLPSFSATWTVDREIAPDLGFAEEYQKTVQARIDQMTNDADKKRAAESLEGAVAFIRKGTKVAMKVELDYFGKNKFHILHTFYDTNPPSVYEYFANNDGLVYIVEAREKKVRVVKDIPQVLRALGRGIPQLYLDEYWSAIPAAQVVSQTPAQVVLKCVGVEKQVLSMITFKSPACRLLSSACSICRNMTRHLVPMLGKSPQIR